MLLLNLLIAWSAWFHTTTSLLSPAVFLALANIQTQRAKAAANILNWRARNQLNSVLARSQANFPNFPALGSPGLVGFRNPLIRITRATLPDEEEVAPDVHEVSMAELGDDTGMDMLVPMDPAGEQGSGRSAEPDPLFHLHKHKHDIHHHHHHYDAEVFPRPYVPPHPPLHEDFHHYHHLQPQPPLPFPPPLHEDFRHQPPFPTPHGPAQHQGINMNFFQSQHQEGFHPPGHLREAESENGGDQTVGTFNLFDSATPDFPPYQDPRHFDPARAENRQAIVRFIENEQQSIDKIIQTLNRNSYHYNAPSQSSERYPVVHGGEAEYGGAERSRSAEEGQEGGEMNRIGAINTAELNQYPTVSSETEHAPSQSPRWPSSQSRSAETRQEMIADYFETEQKNAQMAMKELQKEHQRNLEILMRNLNEDPDIQIPGAKEPSLGSTNYLDNDEILTKLLQNDPGIESITGISPSVGHIFQVPNRRYSDYYQRHSRSVQGASSQKNLEDALQKQRQLLTAIQEDAKHDEDLRMIGQIGESVVDDMQSRIRNKRGTSRLMTDPSQRFDMPKTLENFGAVTRTAFEDEHAPMYHMRNMVGAAKDAMVATMKIPNQNFLVPSGYDIVPNGQDGLLGDISPKVFSGDTSPKAFSGKGRSTHPEQIDGVMNTFQKVGSVIRGTVESGKEALAHVGTAANHARSAIYSTKHTVPRLVTKRIPQLLRQSRRQTMIFTPRIFDFYKDGQLREAAGPRQDNFVNVGNILDAVGLSAPNPRLKFEKITIEPRQNFLEEEEEEDETMSSGAPALFDNIRVEDIDDVEHDPDLVGNTMNSLRRAQDSVGAKSLKDFIVRMKSQLKSLINNAKATNGKIPRLSGRFRTASRSPPPKDEAVGSSFIPAQLTRPFMEPAGGTMERRSPSGRNRNGAPTVGAINPLVYERVFNERLKPQESFDGTNREPDSTVSTIMKVQGQFLKPFMGQATGKNKHDFFKLYNSGDKSDEDKDAGYDYIELQSVNNK